MRIDRFFIDTPIERDAVKIHDEGLLHQWRKVFRYQTGTQVILLDGSGYEYHALIDSLLNREATCLVMKKKKAPLPQKDIWLCLSLIQKDKFEMAVQKATELGVSHIVPLETEFSNERRINKARVLKIITEASEQCGRGNLPTLHETMTVEKAFAYVREHGATPIVCHKDGELISSLTPDTWNLPAIFVGPEGGWSKEEEEFFATQKIPLLSLSDFTLRAETAAIVGLSHVV